MHNHGGAAFATERPGHWAQPVELENSENFYRVTLYLYRSAQPSANAMQSYEKFGIRTVINLRGLHSDDDEAEGTSLQLVHIPINTWEAGDAEYIVQILQAIRDADKPVLIHCLHGADRTGMAVAMFRIVEQDWSKEEAMRELQEGGFGFHSIWQNILVFIKGADIEEIKSALE